MFWIEGIARTPIGFVLKTLHKDGARTQESLVGLGAKPLNGKTSRTRITSDCQSWLTGSAKPFWEYLGINKFEPQDSHHVFRVVHDGTEFLIPASVFIAAVIRPIKYIHPFLFRPQGLEQMSVPLFDGALPSVGFFVPVNRVTGNIRTVTDGLLTSYSWMHSFPSARRMWDSVYQAAQADRLDVTLPKADITAVLHCVTWNGVQLVTDMVITTLSASEAPFDFASGHTRDIFFHESGSMDWAHEHQAKEGLPPRDGAWSLSDEEWHQLGNVIQKRQAIKHDLRRVIDLILVKLGTGTAWRKLDFQDLNFSIVQATYRRMQRDGRWVALEHSLKTSRTGSELIT
ncbi:MAG: hypothetical protein QM803_18050 [Rhodocyclaceae bacterium]